MLWLLTQANFNELHSSINISMWVAWFFDQPVYSDVIAYSFIAQIEHEYWTDPAQNRIRGGIF
jgi:hypothetical protein